MRQAYLLDWAQTHNNLGTALRDLGEREHDTSEFCQALGDHVSAWQVWYGAAPYDASIVVANTKIDVNAIHTQFSRKSAPKCLQAYSAELKQMGVTNAEPVSP